MSNPLISPSESTPKPLPSTLGSLIQALERLDQLLTLAVQAAISLYGPELVSDSIRGLYISPAQATRLVTRPPGKPGLGAEIQSHGVDPKIQPLPKRFTWLGQLFREQKPETALPISHLPEPKSPPPESAAFPDETLTADQLSQILPLVRDLHPDSPMGWLANEYGLTSFDLDILIICLAPELDLRYERLYAFLQDDVTRRRPSVDLTLNLLCTTSEEKALRRQHFSANAPLVSHGLIHLLSDRDEPGAPLLSHYLQLDGQVVNFLLGLPGPDPRMSDFAKWIDPQVGLEASELERDFLQGLLTLAETKLDANEPLRLYFQGYSGSGREQTAEGLANAFDMRLLIVDLPSMLAVDRNLEWGLQLVFRAASFENGIVYFADFDHLRSEEQRLNLRRFWDAMLEDRGLSIFAGLQPWKPVAQQPSGVILIRFALPSYERRFWLWTDELAKSGFETNPADLQAVAARFRLAPAQIAEAALAAANQKQIETGSADPEAEQDLTIVRESLFAAARKQSGHELAKLARMIQPRYVWDDLRLPPDSKQQLLEIVQRVELREKVLVEMGFGEKHMRGRGVTVLFAGPSGTGKTMAAEVLAKQLGLDLYRIDLSSVISKYIGETEKNLERVFQAAENANAILFFDEADALFGKRSEVRDSHDRYANIEISYLLQKMEDYDGVAILATNLRQNLDESFIGRLAVTVSFHQPDEKYRREIWDRIWPENTTPKLKTAEKDHLSRNFKLTGRDIKNIATAAAYQAASENKDIGIEELLRATRREYQKMGKTPSDAELIGTLEDIKL